MKFLYSLNACRRYCANKFQNVYHLEQVNSAPLSGGFLFSGHGNTPAHRASEGSLFFLLMVCSLLFSRCSVIGYLAGQAADPQPYYNPIPTETIIKVKPGKKIKLLLRDSSIAYGKLYAVSYMPREEYLQAYQEARRINTGFPIVPDLGDSLFVRLKNPNPDSLPLDNKLTFSGFGLNRILLEPESGRIVAIPLDNLQFLMDIENNKFDLDAITGHLEKGQIPSRSIIRLLNNDLLMDYKVTDIKQVGLRADRVEWTGFAIGAVVDGLVIITISAIAIDFDQKQ